MAKHDERFGARRPCLEGPLDNHIGERSVSAHRLRVPDRLAVVFVPPGSGNAQLAGNDLFREIAARHENRDSEDAVRMKQLEGPADGRLLLPEADPHLGECSG